MGVLKCAPTLEAPLPAPVEMDTCFPATEEHASVS